MRLIYISGDGRSGSTLLDRILGEMDGVVSCGEIWNCWIRAFKENQKCACGSLFSECAFWSCVVDYVENSASGFNVDSLLDIQKKIMRIRYIPYMVVPCIRTKWYSELLKEYGDLILSFYLAIQKCSGSSYIVDSSKMPLYGLLLHATGRFDLHIIHLVRNSLAVAYSWKRKKVRPEIINKRVYMPVQSSAKSAAGWLKQNLLSAFLAKLCHKSIFLRYEDLTSSPRQEVSRVLEFIDLNVPPPVGRDNKLELGLNHIISGNPMRFKRGQITIRNDSEWKNNMRITDRLIVSLISAPLMIAYGYFSDTK